MTMRPSRRNVPPPTTLRGLPLYHGTTTTELGEKILLAGELRARDAIGMTAAGPGRMHGLNPMRGRVYLTRDINVAVQYALGGAPGWASTGSDSKVRLYGPYGYVFIAQSRDLRDVECDEDVAGYAAYAAAHARPGRSAVGSVELQTWPTLLDAIDNNRSAVLHLRAALAMARPALRQAVVDGDYHAWAKVGRLIAKKSPRGLRRWLASVSPNIAARGPVPIYEAYRFDRSRAGEMRHGSYLSHAERVL